MTAILVAPERKLWTPEEYPLRPVIDRNGNLTVIRPLDLRAARLQFLREEGRDREARAMGLRGAIGGGAAGAWTFTNGGRTSLLDGTFDLDTDTFKMALFLSTSDLGAASTTFAGVSNEHSAANGYTAGGNATVLSLSGTTTVTVDCTDEVWTASGGSIVARFAAIYEVSGNILCYCLLDSTPADVTATTGNTLTVAIHASGVFTLA